MNDVTELVELPDPATHPLVHPLDLPQARRPFRTAWLIGALTSPPVGALAAVIIWFASHNYLVPLLAGTAIIGFGQPRLPGAGVGVHPPQAPGPPAAAAGVLGAGVGPGPGRGAGGGLLLVTFRLDRPDVSVQVRGFTFGMGAAAGLLVMADFVAKLLGSRGPARRRALSPLPGVLALAGSLAVAYGVLFGSAGPGTPATVLWGAVAMLVAGAAVGIWKLLAASAPT
jgi:hypothetical protein